MRKLLALLISATLMLSFVACSDGGNIDDTDGQNQDVHTETDSTDSLTENVDQEITEENFSSEVGLTLDYYADRVVVTFSHPKLADFHKDILSTDEENVFWLSIDNDMHFDFSTLGGGLSGGFYFEDEFYEDFEISNTGASWTVPLDIFPLTPNSNIDFVYYDAIIGAVFSEVPYDEYYFIGDNYADGFEPIINIVDSSVQETDIVTNLDNDMFLIKDGVLVEYRGTDTDVVVPNGVTVIGENSFSLLSTDIISVTLPESVIEIEEQAFYYSTLSSINLPNGISKIGRLAFGECTSLTSITLPSSLTVIEEAVFEGCVSLTDVSIPSSVTTIKQNAFAFCDNLQLEIPSTVTNVSEHVFG